MSSSTDKRNSSITINEPDLYPLGTELVFSSEGEMPSGMFAGKTYAVGGTPLGKPLPFTDTWIRCNRGTGPHCGRALYPCFDLDEERADYDARGRRFFWTALVMLMVAVLATWPIWGGR